MKNEEESEGEEMSSSSSRDDYYSSQDEMSYEKMEKQLFGKYGSTGKKRDQGSQGDKSTKKSKIYCAICAGKHHEDKCKLKMFTKSSQLNSVRQRFADA